MPTHHHLVHFGIDRLLKEETLQNQLHGKRLALVAHPASMTMHFQHSLDALMAQPKKFHVTAAFGPQHGMRGEKQDNMMETEDYLDPLHQIPIFSLYGEVRRPTKKMMETFDVLLVDMQDVGTRIYTFLTTLLYVMEACAAEGKQIWVLDRPNPAGRPIEGSLLQEGWVSFVGAAVGIPMRHGLTLGEFANWFKARLRLNVDLKVITMQGYQPKFGPGFGWPLQERAWVNPSPNAASASMPRTFPGTVLIEGTTLSEGRGTTRPLETVGASDIKIMDVWKQMNVIEHRWLRGCDLRLCYFQPTFHKHVGKICEGFQMHTDGPGYNHHEFKPYRLTALWLKAIRTCYPDYKIWRDFHYEYEKDRLAFDLINGGPLLREWIDDRSAKAYELEEQLVQHEQAWLHDRAEFLLYKD